MSDHVIDTESIGAPRLVLHGEAVVPRVNVDLKPRADRYDRPISYCSDQITACVSSTLLVFLLITRGFAVLVGRGRRPPLRVLISADHSYLGSRHGVQRSYQAPQDGPRF